MDFLAFGLCCILTIISAIHFFWAFGGIWPVRDEITLARTVVGTIGIQKMPHRGFSFVVGLIILGAAFWPLMWRALIPYFVPQGMVWAGMFGLTMAFLARGLAGYLPMMSKRHNEQPFAWLNKRIFSPLCLGLAGCFALLLLYL